MKRKCKLKENKQKTIESWFTYMYIVYMSTSYITGDHDLVIHSFQLIILLFLFFFNFTVRRSNFRVSLKKLIEPHTILFIGVPNRCMWFIPSIIYIGEATWSTVQSPGHALTTSKDDLPGGTEKCVTSKGDTPASNLRILGV